MLPGQAGGRSQMWGFSMTFRPSARACAVTARSRSSDSAMRWPPQRISVASFVLWKPNGVIEIQRTPMPAQGAQRGFGVGGPVPLARPHRVRVADAAVLPLGERVARLGPPRAAFRRPREAA